jgi:cell cycle serine/threonine-protein kinase CDC5/MSD2
MYVTLELCLSDSLMNMLHRLRVFTEPEARFFMVQLLVPATKCTLTRSSTAT